MVGKAYVARLVVEKTVFEHEAKVIDTLLPTVVDIVLQLLLDGAHVHGVLDHLVVVLCVQVCRRTMSMISPF